MADRQENDDENNEQDLDVFVVELNDTDSSDNELGNVMEDDGGDDMAEEEEEEVEDEEDADQAENFDQSLPATHAYLGQEMDEFSGRTVLDQEDVVTIPLLNLPGIVLVPGQTVPLHIFQPQSVSMMQNVIEKDRTFGIVSARFDSESGQRLYADIGTTAEIFSMKEENDAGIVTLTVKAVGRQRFKIIETRRQVDGVWVGRVKILSELQQAVYPQDSLCSAVKTFEEFYDRQSPRKKCTSKVVNSLSSWPTWVYRLYNPFILMKHIKVELKNWNESLRTDNLPKDASEFSFWVAANLPIDDQLRLQLLDLNSPVLRLRRELDIMKRCTVLCCKRCKTKIVEKSDLFSMSLTGPLAAYVNPGGFVHETLTFYKARGLRLIGRASSENSWFPGYAWTIAECSWCMSHMGWKFTSVKRGLKPSKFWGLTRSALIPTFCSDAEEEGMSSTQG